ncbi:Protein NSG2 [Lachancea thermotolerans]|uniref:KLTH0B06116p n=1 Tax=Lachancea thermotolerans (strain ATCC 56472 / CBS 6340 / NRRL Y-8284) TaxID=559295 RepID=C5DCV5_LACTC|nr:KLTH0B06116p [Lachancea thermotolerans CBS 6340]CAR21616.1 KLTH0B06116p [Lachancea thermotolerans CBS 6340]
MARKKAQMANGNYSVSSESISNLTRPQLYGIYDADITHSEDAEVYEEAKKSVGKFPEDMIKRSGAHGQRSMLQRATHILFSLTFLGVAGISYNELSKQLHDNHELHEEFASRPLALGVEICRTLSFGVVPTWMAYALEGVLFGALLPLMDTLWGSPVRTTTFTSFLRSTNAMLGVAFGIRKIEWSSSLQASGAWFLLNIVLWMFFDGTPSMLLGCLGIGTIASVTSYRDVTEFSQMLYFMDFYFLGLLLFGKLGRYLYGHRA